MADVTVTGRAGDPHETEADTLVVPVFEGESLDDPTLQALVDSGEAKPGLRKLAVTHVDGRRIVLVGVGKRDELDHEKARVAAAVAAARAQELGARSLAWAAPAGEGVAGAVVEGTLLATYRFDRFKSKKESDDDAGVQSVEIASADGVDVEEVESGRVGAHGPNAARGP